MTDLPAQETFREAIIACFPEFAGARFSAATTGWHSTAVDVDGRMIFKFPKHAEAERALRREATLLAAVRPRLTMPVPELTLHVSPHGQLFSRHEKLHGDHLVTSDYTRLDTAAKNRLADDLALFYAELHDLDDETMAAAGALPITPWFPAERILETIEPVLPPELRPFAERTVAAWFELTGDPYGTTYGFFDGHGWNMAFDHAAGRLNGIYDFADSGFGALHQDFIYSNLIAADLTGRIVGAYERMAGRPLDRERIAILTGMHRLSELAELAHEPGHVPDMLRHLAEWVSAC